MKINLYPLTILNISDHYNRYLAQNIGSVYGIVLGKKEDKNKIYLLNSFEISASDNVIDVDFMKIKEAQFKEVFEDLEIVGWYSVSSNTDLKDETNVHEQITKLYPNILYLKMSSHFTTENEIPIAIYEFNSTSPDNFSSVPYTIHIDEDERISLQHLAHTQAHSDNEPDLLLSNGLLMQQSALKLLNERLQKLIKYVRDVRDQKIPPDYQILQTLASLLNQIDSFSLNNPAYKQMFLEENNNVAVMRYMTEMINICDTCCQFAADKTNGHNVMPGTRIMDKKKELHQ